MHKFMPIRLPLYVKYLGAISTALVASATFAQAPSDQRAIIGGDRAIIGGDARKVTSRAIIGGDRAIIGGDRAIIGGDARKVTSRAIIGGDLRVFGPVDSVDGKAGRIVIMGQAFSVKANSK